MTFRYLGFFLATLTFCAAREAPDGSASKPKDSNFEVRLLAEAAPESLGQVFLAEEKTKSAPVTLPTNQLSDPIPVATRVLVLKTLEKEIPLCTINLPEVGKSFAVVLVTAKPAGYSPIIVRTDDPGFKAGDVFFINRSENTVLGKLGGTPLVLKPGEAKKDRPTDAKENTYYDIAFATREAAGDKLISSSRWPVDNLLRSYVFFFTNGQGKTTFRAVDEYMTPPATAKP